jgi:hypothetical protein
MHASRFIHTNILFLVTGWEAGDRDRQCLAPKPSIARLSHALHTSPHPQTRDPATLRRPERAEEGREGGGFDHSWTGLVSVMMMRRRRRRRRRMFWIVMSQEWYYKSDRRGISQRYEKMQRNALEEEEEEADFSNSTDLVGGGGEFNVLNSCAIVWKIVTKRGS